MSEQRLDNRICRGLVERDAEHVVNQWMTSGSLRARLTAVLRGDIETSRKKSDSKELLAGDVAVNLAYEVGYRAALRDAIRLLGLTEPDNVL